MTGDQAVVEAIFADDDAEVAIGDYPVLAHYTPVGDIVPREVELDLFRLPRVQ